MKLKELFRIVWLNIIQNKFKVFLTSVGILAGTITIVMVFAIGQGGKAKVASQFKNLNAGAIDISYTMESGNKSDSSGDSSGGSGKSSFQQGGMPSFGGGASSQEGMPSFGGGASSQGGQSSSGGQSQSPSMGQPPQDNGNMPDFSQGGGSFPGGMMGGFGRNLIRGESGSDTTMMNREKIVLSTEEVDNIETFVPNIDSVTISLSSKTGITGGNLEEETTYSIGGVKSSYASISNLTLQMGDFLTDENDENKEKVCVLGASVAEELFDDVVDAYDSTIYIDGRPYVINGVLSGMGTVSSGISPDDTIFIPYETGVKYITGSDVSPTITVIASDTDEIKKVKENIETVLAESYPNAEFTLTDAGSKMEAANESNRTLTLLLIGMAVVVFFVGGIGIMNVLFVSVKERTKEIGILKAVGFSRRDILVEFLSEACLISIFGGLLGVAAGLAVVPVAAHFEVAVLVTPAALLCAVFFAIVTGTLFGFYPAWKASRLVPVDALAEE